MRGSNRLQRTLPEVRLNAVFAYRARQARHSGHFSAPRTGFGVYLQTRTKLEIYLAFRTKLVPTGRPDHQPPLTRGSPRRTPEFGDPPRQTGPGHRSPGSSVMGMGTCAILPMGQTQPPTLVPRAGNTTRSPGAPARPLLWSTRILPSPSTRRPAVPSQQC